MPALLDQLQERLQLRRYSPRTRKVYVGHARRFLEWLATTRPPDDVARSPLPGAPRPADARAYLLYMTRDERIAIASQRQILAALSFLFREVLGVHDALRDVPRPRREHRLPRVLSRDDVARILAATPNPAHRLALELAYSAGLRVGEVVRLRVGDVDVARGTITVRASKGRKDRMTLLAQAVARSIERHPRPPTRAPGSSPAPAPTVT